MSKIFVILSVLGMALATTACGGDSHPAVAACETTCANQDALACEGAMVDLATCNQICAAYGSAPTECADAAEAAYTCWNGATLECTGMSSAPVDGGCATETEAMTAACSAE